LGRPPDSCGTHADTCHKDRVGGAALTSSSATTSGSVASSAPLRVAVDVTSVGVPTAVHDKTKAARVTLTRRARCPHSRQQRCSLQAQRGPNTSVGDEGPPLRSDEVRVDWRGLDHATRRAHRVDWRGLDHATRHAHRVDWRGLDHAR
jgi:hypothetical protein